MDSEFLDSHQYTPEGIQGYESVWGAGFVSPGGAAKAREFVKALDLKPGSVVLDVGCGLGGSAFLMAAEFGLQVEGIDLSQNMLDKARARCLDLGLQDKVELQLRDALELDEHGKYDAVYSRDAFLHIHRKGDLFRNLHQALRPNGVLLLTDYCCTSEPWSPGFSRYVETYQYCLHPLKEYEGIIREAGFVDVVARDLSAEFIRTLEQDLELLRRTGGPQGLIEGWNNKLERAHGGEQKWGYFKARKAP